MANFINKVRSLTTLSACLFLSMNSLANTDAYTCVKGDEKRIISVVYNTPGQAVPCDVFYEKASEGLTLWHAENETGYCEQKAADFAEKQKSWGFICEKGLPIN